MRIVTFALLVLFVLPTWASEPGQPFDCDDWIFHESGLACTRVGPIFLANALGESHTVFDNADRLL